MVYSFEYKMNSGITIFLFLESYIPCSMQLGSRPLYAKQKPAADWLHKGNSININTLEQMILFYARNKWHDGFSPLTQEQY